MFCIWFFVCVCLRVCRPDYCKNEIIAMKSADFIETWRYQWKESINFWW